MIPQGGLTPSQDSLSFKEIVAAVQGRSVTWEGHHHTLQNLILRYSEHIYINMHTYVMYTL